MFTRGVKKTRVNVACIGDWEKRNNELDKRAKKENHAVRLSKLGKKCREI